MTHPSRLHLVASCAWLVLCGDPAALSAQQPVPGPVTLSGVVIDRASGGPVPGALITLTGRGVRVIADSTGAFTVAGLGTGDLLLTVERYGYRRAEVNVALTGAPEPLRIPLEPDPVQLEALVVTGSALVSMNGRVLDAATREPVPWAEVWLTRDAVRDAARASAGQDGTFELEEVAAGAYLLRVERLGYQSRYLPVGAFGLPAAIEVLLEPDSAMMSGLALMASELGTRRNSTPFGVRVFDEQRLRRSPSPDVRHFLRNQPSLRWTGCQGSETMDCVIHRQSAVPPRVYIDELLRNLEDLESFEPSDLFQLETFTCSRRVEIRAYTVGYMEQAARRPRIVLPAC